MVMIGALLSFFIAAEAPDVRRRGAAMATAPAPWMAARRPVDICMVGEKAAAEPMKARAAIFMTAQRGVGDP
ncbi:hypothetical protein T484DRAFT_1825447 [Baffinella frigidus]|nr:hypothetical protein T484DRAFT_1825447 [Cryptophyta sp. CCMP2293]